MLHTWLDALSRRPQTDPGVVFEMVKAARGRRMTEKLEHGQHHHHQELDVKAGLARRDAALDALDTWRT